eukprot:2229457-Rhodomonas_salina.2
MPTVIIGSKQAICAARLSPQAPSPPRFKLSQISLHDSNVQTGEHRTAAERRRDGQGDRTVPPALSPDQRAVQCPVRSGAGGGACGGS